jgi:predicted ATPase
MESTERIERLLCMILLGQMPGAQQTTKIEVLSRAGFKTAEIAELIGSTPKVVNQLAYLARRSKGKKRTAAKQG